MGIGGLVDLAKRLKDRRLGFRIDEVMEGEHELEPGFGPAGRQPMEFRITWGPDDIGAWLRPHSGRFLWQELVGSVTMVGFCEGALCKGELELRYFADRRLRYDFEFSVHDKTYRYVGEKVNIRPWNLPVSHTTCFGRVIEKDTGRLVSTSVVHFHWRRLPGFLASMRLT
ncbi:MAG: hypothetical protein V2A73_19100 [Pseudomonadota bacterium]